MTLPQIDCERQAIESPDTALWCAVIDQALRDYFVRWNKDDLEGLRESTDENRDNLIAYHQRIRQDAERFLFEPVGGWARSRREVCIAAGVDPDWLREKAIKMRAELESNGALRFRAGRNGIRRA
jgi:hypothetical protein